MSKDTEDFKLAFNDVALPYAGPSAEAPPPEARMTLEELFGDALVGSSSNIVVFHALVGAEGSYDPLEDLLKLAELVRVHPPVALLQKAEVKCREQEEILCIYMSAHGYELVRTNNSIFFRLVVEPVTAYMKAHTVISVNNAVKKYNREVFETGRVTKSLKIQQSGNRIVVLDKRLELL